MGGFIVYTTNCIYAQELSCFSIRQQMHVTADVCSTINPLTAKLFNLNFYSFQVVSRCRDPQLQVSENYSDLPKWRSPLFKSC